MPSGRCVCLAVAALLSASAGGCGFLPSDARPAPELRPVFDAINVRAFDGKLDADLWTGTDNEAYGRCRPDGGTDDRPVLLVDRRLSGRALEAVMAHEMVHLRLHGGGLFEGLGGGDHGPRFRAECARVADALGLPVVLLTGNPYADRGPPGTIARLSP